MWWKSLAGALPLLAHDWTSLTAPHMCFPKDRNFSIKPWADCMQMARTHHAAPQGPRQQRHSYLAIGMLMRPTPVIAGLQRPPWLHFAMPLAGMLGVSELSALHARSDSAPWFCRVRQGQTATARAMACVS